MLVNAGSLAVAALVVVLAYARDRWLSRAHDRERQAWTLERAALVDRLLFATGKTWTPPPVRDRPAREPDPDRELATF